YAPATSMLAARPAAMVVTSLFMIRPFSLWGILVEACAGGLAAESPCGAGLAAASSTLPAMPLNTIQLCSICISIGYCAPHGYAAGSYLYMARGDCQQL